MRIRSTGNITLATMVIAVVACSVPGASPTAPAGAAPGESLAAEMTSPALVELSTTSSGFPGVTITCSVPATVTVAKCRVLAEERLSGAPLDLPGPISSVEVRFSYSSGKCSRFNSSLLDASGTALETTTGPCPPM